MEAETLGEKIKRLRDLRRMSQEELGGELGVSAKTVSNWESGRNDPRNSIAALREFFGRSFDAGSVEVDQGADDVERAIEASELTRGNKKRLLGAYFDMLDQQQRGAS